MSNAAAAPADLIKSGSDATFLADVVEASRAAPVLVDFWAPWCGPCRQLTPALERAVTAARGGVRLVKINIDENPGIAGQLGVRSIPAVFAFHQGRPVDGFVGSLPESQLNQFIARLLGGADPGEDVEAILQAAGEALRSGDFSTASQAFGAVLELEPENTKAIAGLARCFLAAGDPAQAREILGLAPAGKANDAELTSVRAALDLAAKGAGGGEAGPLRAKVQADPADLEARFALANALVGRGELAEAADHLLAIIERDRAWNEDGARKLLLQVFDAAGLTSEIARNGRRKLSALLFS